MDHPRSRGVYTLSNTAFCCGEGSSPLARGLRVHRHHIHGTPRIIPARAGFTTSFCRRTICQPDHPRSRGVYWARRIACLRCRGSSPLARGLRISVRGGGSGSRIIPARAGFTYTTRTYSKNLRDHPRSRGVYDVNEDDQSLEWGSSPLARGLHHHGVPEELRFGIIPARAGFTSGHVALRI